MSLAGGRGMPAWMEEADRVRAPSGVMRKQISPGSARPARAVLAPSRRDPRQVWLRLTDEQVSRAVRQVPLFAVWLASIRGILWLRAEAGLGDKALSRPLLYGWVVLAAMPADASLVRAKDIAEEVGLSEASVKRALRTLAAIGLLEYDPVTNRYRMTLWHP